MKEKHDNDNDNDNDNDDNSLTEYTPKLQKFESSIMDCDNNWTDKNERLLMRWAEKAAGYRWLHNMARINFKKTHDYLSYPTIILSSITGVGGFAVLNPSSSNDISEPNKQKILLIQYIFAFMNVISGIITSISKFNNSLQLSEAHSTMCIQYSKFYRNIDMELSLEKTNRVNAIKFVAKCRQEYDRLLSEAPDIPYRCILAFNKDFPNKEIKPDVCNGLNFMNNINSNQGQKFDDTIINNINKWFLKSKNNSSNDNNN
jgi:hypothetical protein